MEDSFALLANLFIVFIAAIIGAEIAQRLKMPAVVGEIAAGVAVSPAALGWITLDHPLEALSELGVVLLLFAVGLETSLADLRSVGRRAVVVAGLGVALPFVLGAGWAVLQEYPTPKALFVGAAFVATSAGITANVLRELGVLRREESRLILGAAVIDDILAMLLLGVVTSFQSHGEVDVPRLLLIVLQALAFVAIIAVVGRHVVQKKANLLELPLNPLSPLCLSLAACLGLAAAAAYIGLAAIIGAFLAGMILSESPQRAQLEKQVSVLVVLLTPFFFVSTGAKVDLGLLASWSAVTVMLSVTVLAFLGKLIGCGIGARGLGARSALIVGVGMAPRGEVGIIVASLGLAAGAFSPELYGIIIAMSLLTSVAAPPLLARLFGKENAQPPAGVVGS